MTGLAVRPRLVTTSSPGSPYGASSAGQRIQHLADVLALVDVQESRRVPALEAERADFGQAVMVDDARAPALLDARARGRNAAARLASHDRARARVRRPARRRPCSAAHLGQSQRVGRRAADDGGTHRRRSAPAASGSTCRRREWRAGPSGRRPRSRPRSRGTARTKTERTRDRRQRRGRRDSTDLPAVEHPLPALAACRSTAADGRSSTRSGSTACSWPAAR